MFQNNYSSHRKTRSTIDWTLVLIYLVLVLIGLVNIYASVHSSEPGSLFDFSYRSGKQFVWILTSLGLAAFILFLFNARYWEVISTPLYLIVLGLLVAVIFLGVDVKGSRSWFALGPVRFQPAEVSKITTSLVLATIMSKPNFRFTRMKHLVRVALVIGIPMLVILAESETGSALVYVGYLFMLYREGLSGWLLFFLGVSILIFILTLTASPFVSMLVLIAIAAMCLSYYTDKPKNFLIYDLPFLFVMCFIPAIWRAVPVESFVGGIFQIVKPLYLLLMIVLIRIPFLAAKAFRQKLNHLWIALAAVLAGIVLVFSVDFIFNDVLQDHQRKRIEVLLGMKDDPAGVGYNVNQSKIAIGSGGFFGKGYLNGTQTAFGFVPEQSTDFIFCTVGEEWGFLGCLFVIALYVALIMRLLSDAEKSRETFTRIYGYCVASLIFMHLFINIGMTIGLMPVIGIPLPLLSYGGSSLWAFTILIFIFIALYRNEKKYF